MVTAIKGNVSDDPRVEHEFEADPLTYKGKLRISTGLAIVAGIEDLTKKAHLITCPLTIHHGANDRVTDPNGSKMFFEKVATPRPNTRASRSGPATNTVCLPNPSLCRAMCALADPFLLVDDATVMMKHVQGMSEEDTQKTLDVLTEIVSCTCLHCDVGDFADFCIGAVL